MAFCGKCGTQLSEGAKFCPKCGNPCENSSDQSSEGGSLVKQAKKNVPTKAIITICLAIAVICGGWLVWKRFGNRYSLEGLAKAMPNYDFVNSFHDGMAKVVKDGKYGYIDLQGNEVIPCKYIDIDGEPQDDFSEGIACVFNGDKFGYIDKTGKEIIPFIYDYGCHFSEGLAMVLKNNKAGFTRAFGRIARGSHFFVH